METGVLAPPQSLKAATTVTARRVTALDADLSPFADPEKLASGQVTLLSVEGVAEQLGGDWQPRRREVYDRASRTLSKRLAEGGAFVRVSETDYLIVQPNLDATVAEAKALRVLGEIATLFLAELADADLRLFRVASVSPGQVVGALRDPQDIRRAETSPRPATDRLTTDTPAGRWAPFTTGGGRKVRPSCSLEPVFELGGNNRIGFRLRRKVVDVETGQDLSAAEQAALSRGDILRIDLATIARGADRLKAATRRDQALSLIIPVSLLSLTHPEGGAELAKAFAQARRLVRAGVIGEVCDIEGAPEHVLVRAVSLIKPYCLFVAGHLADEKPRANPAMKAAGIQATSFTCPDQIDGDAQFLGWLRAALRAARRIGRSAMVYGCASPRRLALAGLLGATHGGMAPKEALI